MGRRTRRRAEAAEPSAPTATYCDPQAGVLELRGALSPASRAQYATTLRGGRDREDAWQRAIELLFERLAVSWTIAGVRAESQRELLGRYRLASAQERRFVRDSLRSHLAEHFPEMEAP
jgi:hypothetical protein